MIKTECKQELVIKIVHSGYVINCWFGIEYKPEGIIQAIKNSIIKVGEGKAATLAGLLITHQGINSVEVMLQGMGAGTKFTKE